MVTGFVTLVNVSAIRGSRETIVSYPTNLTLPISVPAIVLGTGSLIGTWANASAIASSQARIANKVKAAA